MQLLTRPARELDAARVPSFELLGFAVRSFQPGERLEAATGEREYALVILGGVCSLATGGERWRQVGERSGVFSGMPSAFYIPRDASFELTADTACEVAFCSAPAARQFPARRILPGDVEVEIRGGENATRQINHILKPDFPADRLLVVEVYTPSGNWSSYPPHKHDVHNPPGEVDLEEIYYYKVNRPEGYAIQRVYTKDRRLDQTLTVRDGDHPVVAAHGYDVYYLNAATTRWSPRTAMTCTI